VSLVPGQTLSQYEILAKLGQGAFRTDRNSLETRRPLVGFDGSQVHESFGIAPDGNRLVVSTVEQVRAIHLADRLPSLR